jgi:hypothetical protein
MRFEQDIGRRGVASAPPPRNVNRTSVSRHGVGLAGLRFAASVTVWVSFAVLVSLHLYLRGIGDNGGIAPVDLSGIEGTIFRVVPSVWLQERLPVGSLLFPFLKWSAFWFHFSWFEVPIILALFVHVRCGTARVANLLAFHVSLLLTCDIFYAAQPTRPPWMDAEAIRVFALIWGDRDVIDPNPNSALPSLHMAMPVMYTLWFAHQREPALRRIAPFIALWALGIGWVVVYSAEHYVIDIAAGAAWAVVWYYAFGALITASFWSRLRIRREVDVAQPAVVPLPARARQERREAA